MNNFYWEKALQKLLFSFFLIIASFTIASAQSYSLKRSFSTDCNDKQKCLLNLVPSTSMEVIGDFTLRMRHSVFKGMGMFISRSPFDQQTVTKNSFLKINIVNIPSKINVNASQHTF